MQRHGRHDVQPDVPRDDQPDVQRDVLLFGPAAAATDELEATLVAGREIVLALAGELTTPRSGAVSRHYLLVGPPGSGKTHAMETLARQLARDARVSWRVVRVPSESLGCHGLDELLATLVAGDSGAELPWSSPAPPASDSLAVLSARGRETGRPLLVLIENLPRLIRRALRERSEVQRLAALLASAPPFTVIAAAPCSLADSQHKDERVLKPCFYELAVGELDRPAIDELIRRRAAYDGASSQEAAAILARVHALRPFTGSLARPLLALYSALRTSTSAPDLMRPFLAMLDRLGPFYQAQLDAISAQQARVLIRMALAPGPTAAARLARSSGLPTSHTTAVLNILLGARLVRRSASPGKRRTLYEISDRLLRIWLVMSESTSARHTMRELIGFYQVYYQLAGQAPGAAQTTAQGLREAIARHQEQHPAMAAAFLAILVQTLLLDGQVDEAERELAGMCALAPEAGRIARLAVFVAFARKRFAQVMASTGDDSVLAMLRVTARYLAGEPGSDHALRRAIAGTPDELSAGWSFVAGLVPPHATYPGGSPEHRPACPTERSSPGAPDPGRHEASDDPSYEDRVDWFLHTLLAAQPGNPQVLRRLIQRPPSLSMPGGELPEPWRSVRRYLQSGCDVAVLRAMHPEACEAVRLLTHPAADPASAGSGPGLAQGLLDGRAQLARPGQ